MKKCWIKPRLVFYKEYELGQMITSNAISCLLWFFR